MENINQKLSTILCQKLEFLGLIPVALAKLSFNFLISDKKYMTT